MRELALNCLAWMVYVQRSLSTRELQHALATSSECKTRRDLHLDRPEVILEACGNLLEESNRAIRPIHYTVQEFLTTAVQGRSLGTVRTQLLDSYSMHARLSVACLAYIHLSAFDRPAAHYWELYNRLRSSSFAGYACQSFDYHIVKCKDNSADATWQLEKLFQQKSQYLAAVLQIKVLRDGFEIRDIVRRFDLMQFSVSASTIVYSTSLYNVPSVRQRWGSGALPIYALHLASAAGLGNAIVRLLDAECDVNERDGRGSTPLYHACLEGQLEIIRMILSAGADVSARGGHFGNALQAASYKGHKAVVKMLLDKGADVNAQGGLYGNALQAASYGGHEQVVKTLLDKGADVNAQGGTLGNALQAASAGGHKAVVKMLEACGARSS
jgi:hypothetical protein